MTKEEIVSRKGEIKALLEDATKDVDLEEIKRELDTLDAEEQALEQPSEEKVEETKEVAEDDKKDVVEEQHESEERKEIAKKLNARSNEEVKEIKKEEKKMEERKFDLSSKEYRFAWAKTLMGVSLDETEKRALGDAIGTTATTFVQSTADTQGINNMGLLIPTSVRTELMERIGKLSPFFADVRKLAVEGNVDLPYLDEADDAQWVSELTCTPNEGQEYKNLQLTGWELAKDIVITWKAEKMGVEQFIAYILEELTEKMGKALAKAVLYGDGSSKPTGAVNGLTPVRAEENEGIIDIIKNVKASLSSDAKVGAKLYIAEDVADELTFYKDGNGNYPYLAGLPRIAQLEVAVDPFMNDGDIVIGNASRNYLVNFNEDISVAKETTIKCRRTTYGAYAIVDGKPKPNTFALGSTKPASV